MADATKPDDALAGDEHEMENDEAGSEEVCSSMQEVDIEWLTWLALLGRDRGDEAPGCGNGR